MATSFSTWYFSLWSIGLINDNWRFSFLLLINWLNVFLFLLKPNNLFKFLFVLLQGYFLAKILYLEVRTFPVIILEVMYLVDLFLIALCIVWVLRFLRILRDLWLLWALLLLLNHVYQLLSVFLSFFPLLISQFFLYFVVLFALVQLVIKLSLQLLEFLQLLR